LYSCAGEPAVESCPKEPGGQRYTDVLADGAAFERGSIAQALLPIRLPCVGEMASLQEWEGGVGEVQLEEAPRKDCGNAESGEMKRDTSLIAS